MTGFTNRWTPLFVSTALAWGVWLVAAVNGHGWELLWLPGVVAGAAWPRGDALRKSRIWRNRCSIR